MSRRHTYPHFHITGTVSAIECADGKTAITVQASGYISHRDDVHGVLERDAKWKLESLGLPKETLDGLYFEYQDYTFIQAIDAKGLRIEDGERPEAFFDSPTLKNRATLIRQRRLVPEDQRAMLAIYAPKVKAAAPAADAVAA